MPFSSFLPGLKKLSYGLIIFFSNELMTTRALTDPVGFAPCSDDGRTIKNPTNLNILLFALSRHIPTFDIMTIHAHLYAQCTEENENPLHLIAQSGTDSDFQIALNNAPRALLTAKNKMGKTAIDILIDKHDYTKVACVIEQLLPNTTEALFYAQLAQAITTYRTSPTDETKARIDQLKLSLLTFANPVTDIEKKLLNWATNGITRPLILENAESYGFEHVLFDLKMIVPIFTVLALIYHCTVRIPAMNRENDSVSIILMNEFVKMYCTKDFIKDYKKGMPLQANYLKKTATFVDCRGVKKPMTLDRKKLAAFINKRLIRYEIAYYLSGGGIFSSLKEDKTYIGTELFKTLVRDTQNHLHEQQHEKRRQIKNETKQAERADEKRVDEKPPLQKVTPPVKTKRPKTISMKSIATSSHPTNITLPETHTTQDKSCEALQKIANQELTTDLLMHAHFTHHLNFAMRTVESKLEGLETIPEINKCFRALESAFSHFSSYIKSQEEIRKAYQTARQQLETAAQQNELELLRKALSDYQTKVETTKNWLKIRENKFNTVIELRGKLQSIIKTHRDKKTAPASSSPKDNARERDAEQAHADFIKGRAEAKAARLAEKMAGIEAQQRAAFIPLRDATGIPLLHIENLLMQLNNFQPETQTLLKTLHNDIARQRTIHLSQQFIYLQLFHALSTLAQTELAPNLPNINALEALRNKFAHQFSTLKRNIHWETLSEITVACFTDFTQHYLYHHGIQQPPAAIELPDIYQTLFTAKQILDWKVAFSNLQDIYALLSKALNDDETLTLNSLFCNAMRMIIVQLNEHIKSHYYEINAPHGASSLLAIYRNQDAHPILQHDMTRETLLNLAATIASLSVKATPLPHQPMTLFQPFTPNPSPYPHLTMWRPQ